MKPQKNNTSTTETDAKKSFSYLGHTFTPLRSFKGRQREVATKRLNRIGIDNYNGGKWDWEGFYKVAPNNIDLFVMDGKTIVCPCQNELFEYTGEPLPPTAGERTDAMPGKKNFFAVTVHIVMEADSEGEASDSMSACLTQTLEHNGAILDWGYAAGGGAIDLGIIDKSQYEEGDFISTVEAKSEGAKRFHAFPELVEALGKAHNFLQGANIDQSNEMYATIEMLKTTIQKNKIY